LDTEGGTMTAVGWGTTSCGTDWEGATKAGTASGVFCTGTIKAGAETAVEVVVENMGAAMRVFAFSV